MSATRNYLSLRGLRTFCIAAEHRSFRKAGDRLSITASAVSHQIKNLEEELGTKLFERLPRSIALTDAGQSLYTDLQPLIAEIDGIGATHRRGRSRSTLRISVQPFFASELFVPALSDFTTRHPEVDLKVDTSDESAETHPSSADVSIRVFRTPPEGLAADRLFGLNLVPAASQDFIGRFEHKGDEITGDFPRIVHESRPNAWRAWATATGISLPTTSNLIRLDSMIAVARAAERGLGAALVPVQLSDSWFESGALVRLFPDELPTDDAYYFVCRKQDRTRQDVRELHEWVLQQFGDTA